MSEVKGGGASPKSTFTYFDSETGLKLASTAFMHPPEHWSHRHAPPTKALNSFFINGAPDIYPVKDPPKAMLEGCYVSHRVAVGDQHQVILGRLEDHPLKVYDLVVWGAFEELRDHYHDLFIGHFCQHKKKPYPH